MIPRVAVVAAAMVLPVVAASPAGARATPNYAAACRQAARVVADRSALPPLPLNTVLPHAQLAVVARVAAGRY